MEIKYMVEAIKIAQKAIKYNEVPIGAVIVFQNKIIAKAYNKRKKKKLVTNHAEIDCILKANKMFKDWRLNGCDLYITLEPCKMCKGIIEESRIDNVYYLLNRNVDKKSYSQSKYQKIEETIELKVEREKYLQDIKFFFKKLR